jgi:hypothetical protein
MKISPIITFHRNIIEKDPVAGKELCRLNAEHLKSAMNMSQPLNNQEIKKAKKQIKKSKRRRK